MNVFQTAKQVSCSDAAQRLGMKGKGKRWLCPFHDDHDPSMACYEDSGRFYCFSCHAKGDAVDLWARVRGMSLRDAAYDLCRAYGLSVVEETYQDIERRKRWEEVAQIPLAVLEDWHRCMLSLLEEEVNACTKVMETYHDPEGWIWKLCLQRAIRLNDEAARLKALERADLAAEVAERLRDGDAGSEMTKVTAELLRDILDDTLRTGGMRLTPEERSAVHRALGIA